MLQNKSKTKLTLDLVQGKCNGYFESRWIVNDKEILYNDGSSKLPDNLDLDVELPCQIKIHLTGRTDNDHKQLNGKVLASKYIETVGAKLSGIPIEKNVLENLCQFIDEHGNSNFGLYWDKNLIVEINIPGHDPIEWHLKNNNFSHQYRSGWT